MEEEKKVTQAKPADAAKGQKTELSYEELRAVAGQLQQQNRQMNQQLRPADEYIGSLQTQNLFSYLNFLFKVVEHPDMFRSAFLDESISDIEVIMERLHGIMNPEEENDGTTGAQTE